MEEHVLQSHILNYRERSQGVARLNKKEKYYLRKMTNTLRNKRDILLCRYYCERNTTQTSDSVQTHPFPSCCLIQAAKENPPLMATRGISAGSMLIEDSLKKITV